MYRYALRLLCRNTGGAVSCFNSIQCETDSTNYYTWLTSVGVAEGADYLCTSSDMREGKIGIHAFHTIR